MPSTSIVLRKDVKVRTSATGSYVMEKLFVTTIETRPDSVSFSGTAPIVGCPDGAVVRGEAGRKNVAAVHPTSELAHVPFTPPSHLCRTSIAKMRIVFPDNDFCRPSIFTGHMLIERSESFGHVAVAEVPR